MVSERSIPVVTVKLSSRYFIIYILRIDSMKKAEDVLKQMVDMMPYKFIPETGSYILEAMRIFANDACIEQRKLCVWEVHSMELNLNNNDEYIKDAILNTNLAVQP